MVRTSLAAVSSRFVPGSHTFPSRPEAVMPDARDRYPDEVLAVAPAGAVIVFDGRVWHGYTANRSLAPRRAIQGVFLLRGDSRWPPSPSRRLDSVARARISPLGRYILDDE